MNIVCSSLLDYWSPYAMLTAIIIIVLLGILIFVHELGHFVVARRNGVKADEFGFGFPPRIFGFVKNEKTKKYEFVRGNEEIESKNTIYSINWIPLGGFVKIKGENGADVIESDSFASKKAWPRIKILAAGVVMNFIFAWFLISLGFLIGAPESVKDDGTNLSEAKIQINQIMPDSPAASAGIQVGDEILKAHDKDSFNSVAEVQDYIGANSGKEIVLDFKRGKEIISITIVPEKNEAENKGKIGVSLVKTAIVSYSFFESIWRGAVAVYDITLLIIMALVGIVTSLFAGQGVGADVSGPIGIAIMTKQMASLGFVYILQFAALLSINLAIINALPIPALDGGRILFILIEKIKGSPISHKTEQTFHMIGFLLLILLMILVSLRDVVKIIG